MSSVLYLIMDNYYDEIARSYNELYGLEQKNKYMVIQAALHNLDIEINSSTKILDVGCATGIGQDFFEKNYNADTFGIDPSENLLKQNNYQCMLGEAEELPFEDGEFDIVISITCLQNFLNIYNSLNEIKRVGKKLFIISFLKNSDKAELMDKNIREIFDVINRYEEEKDFIYFLK